MTLLNTKANVEQVANSLKTQAAGLAASIVGTSPTAEQHAQLDEVLKQADTMIDAQLSWSTLQPGFTDIFVKNFTEDQLAAITAFYKTPAGAAMLSTMPTVNKQISEYGSSHLSEKLQPQLRQLFTAFREKQSAAPAPAPTSEPAKPASHTAAPAKPATHTPHTTAPAK